MTTLPASLKFTYDEYCAFPEDGKRHELIAGDHYVTPTPLIKHQRIVANLHRLIGPTVHERLLGTVFCAPVDVLLSHVDVVQPDLLFVSKARTGIITESNIHGAPDLVVEILSEGTRKNDEGIKRLLYERAHVQEYWMVDPVVDTMTRYRLHEGHYTAPQKMASTSPTSILTTSLLPGVSISLPEVFS